MKIATLAIIIQDGKVLLGKKKRGEIGTGTWNGPGGKMEPEDLESLIRCVIRETQEETGGAVLLEASALTELGVITFYAGRYPDFKVHLFYTETHDLPKDIPETDDMFFQWHDIDNLPFDEMLASDAEWFPKVVHKERVNANVYYQTQAEGFQGIEYLSTT